MGYKSELQMIIEAQANTARVLGKVTNDVQKVGKASEASAKRATQSLRSMVSMVQGAAAAYGIVLVNNMAEAGRASQAVTDSFQALNKNAGELLKTLKGASLGLLDETTLERTANKLQAVGFSAERMAETLDLGMKLAAHSGRKYADVVDSLSQALVTGETESFKTLGITIDSAAAIRRYAEENDVAVKSMTALENQQAKVNEVFRVGKKRFAEADVSAISTASARASADISNAKDRIARAFSTMADAGAVGFVAVADAISDWNNNISQAEQRSAGLRTVTVGLNDLFGRWEDRIDDVAEAQRNLAERGRDLIVALGGWRNVIPALEMYMGKLRATVIKTAQAFKDWIVQEAEAQSMRRLSADADDYSSKLDKLHTLMKDEQKFAAELASGWNIVTEARLNAAIAGQAAIISSGELSDLDVRDVSEVVTQEEMKKRAEAVLAGVQGKIDNLRELAAKSGSGGGGGTTQRADRTAELELAKREAQIRLDAIQGVITAEGELFRIQQVQRDALAMQEMTEAERKTALETLLLEQKAERVRVGMDLDKAAADSADDASKKSAAAAKKAADAAARAAKKRSDAEKLAAKAFQQNVDAGINLGSQGLKFFAKNQRILNIIDAARETAQSAKAFAMGNIPGGIGHAIAAASFIKAAATAGKHGGGGGGGSAGGASGAAQAATDQRFTDATTPQEQGGGNVTINVSGFAGSEEKLGGEVVRLINLAGQSGRKINGAAVSDSRREGY